MYNEIKVMINPLHLDEVHNALEDLGISGVNISKCKYFDSPIGPALFFRGKKQVNDSVTEIWLEMVVGQEIVGRVIEIIQKTHGIGWEKAGKISVLPIEEVLSLEPPE
jgi:nitrogen regulatory protein P-II 1